MLRGKIQDWSGKRVDWSGREYQIDSVFEEVRYLNSVEGRYPPQGANVTGGRSESFGRVHYWNEDYIEHHAEEVSHRCGHVAVLTDEYVSENNLWCIPGINDSTNGRNRIQWRSNIKNTKCPTCANRAMPDEGAIAHLMPSDSPEAY